MKTPLRILHLEDDPKDAELICAALEEAGFAPEIVVVQTKADYLARLDQGWEIILADYKLPQLSGLQALALFKERGLDISFILISGAIDEEAALAAMHAGASDYVLKNHLTRLGPAVERGLRETVERRARKQAVGLTAPWNPPRVERRARKQAEAALQESERRWRFALEGAGDGVWDWDVPASTVFFSKRWKEMLGYTEAEIGTGLREWSSRIHPEDMPLVMADLQPHLDALTASYVNEHRVRCKDGSYKWILARGLVITRDHEGNPLRVVGTHKDFTARKHAEAALQAALETQTAILDALPAQIALLDPLGHILTVNASWETFGTANAEQSAGFSIGRNYVDVCDGATGACSEEGRAVAEGLRSVLTGQQPGFTLEYPCHSPQEKRWFRLTATPVSTVRPAGAVVMHVDITAWKIAELRLGEEQARLTGLIDSAMDAIVTVDAAQTIVRVNPAAEVMFGCSAAQILGQPLTRLIPAHSDARHAQDVQAFGDTGASARRMGALRAIWGLRADGQEFPVEASISQVEVGGEKFYTAILRDVTERRQAEAELLRTSGEMRALARHLEVIHDEQAAHIARELHDELGQTLTVLKLHVRAMQKRLEAHAGEPPSFEAHEAIGLIEASVSSLRRLCTELRPPILDHLGLRPALGILAADFQTRSGITCTLEAQEDFPLLAAPLQATVYRLVQELLTNVLRHAGASAVHIVLRETERTLLLDFNDNGCGIADAEQTGRKSLGLLGMRERSLAAGGTITFAGHPGQGTTVHVRLPLDQGSEI